MRIELYNNAPAITDEYTGVVSDGGSISLLSADSPFSNVGQYLKFQTTSGGYLYAYRTIEVAEVNAIVFVGSMSACWYVSFEQFPASNMDIFMLRGSSGKAKLWVRIMKSGDDWLARLYARNDDNSVVSADCPAHPASWWIGQHVMSLICNLRNGDALGFARLSVDPTSMGRERVDLTGLDNDTNMSVLARLDVGSSSVTSSPAIFMMDQILVQSGTVLSSQTLGGVVPPGAPPGGGPGVVGGSASWNWERLQ